MLDKNEMLRMRNKNSLCPLTEEEFQAQIKQRDEGIPLDVQWEKLTRSKK